MTDIRKLKADEIECRVAQCSEKGCSLLLYKTARVDRAILDEVHGDLWQCDFKEINGNMYGGIGIYKKELSQWLWRWDCGTESKTEAEKGQASDCFKRAGFKWGIGVELYTAPFIWINIATKKNDKGKWEVADKFAKFDVKEIDYSQTGKINHLVIVDNKDNVLFNLNSKKPIAKPTPLPKKEEPKKEEFIADADYDIILNVATFNDLPNLTKYFNEMKDKVVDFEAFKNACSARKQAIEKKGA